MAILVSRSGGWTSTIRPHSKRDLRRSNSPERSFGDESLEITICFLVLVKLVKGVEEFFLRALFPSKNVNIVDQQEHPRIDSGDETVSCGEFDQQAISSFINRSLEV